jgi:hypothetical protein
MEFIEEYKQNFTINYHDYEGNTHFVKIPFKFLQRCPNKCYLTCLLKYKNMYGWNVVDDYLLAWFHENLIGECGIESNALEGKGNYTGLWKFKDILCNGVLSKLVNKATRLPHGWVWVKSPNNPHMRILKFRFTDENFYKIDDDDVGIVTTFNFYDNYFQKICEIKELEPRRPYYKAVADALELPEKDKQITKIINKSIRKSKKTSARIKAFGQEQTRSEDCLLWVQKERKINFIRKINTTEGFWDLYLDDEKIPRKVFNIEGYRLSCTGFPRPFIPPSIENNRWVRLFTSVVIEKSQAYDMWILQSDLKKFFKHMIFSGKTNILDNCLGWQYLEKRKSATTIQRFYRRNKKRRSFIFDLVKRTTSIENPEEPLDEWEEDLEEHLDRIEKESEQMSKKLKREDSEEEKQLQLTIENVINNNKDIRRLKKDLQSNTSKHNTITNRVIMINKYIISWKNKLSGNERRYFHIWWFLCFGLKFFTHDRGRLKGGGGKKSSFYERGTDKYLSKGDMEFIFEDKKLRDCLNYFQSLIENITSSIEEYKKSKSVEEGGGLSFLSKRQRSRMEKNNSYTNKLSNEHAYDELEGIIADANIGLEKYINTASLSCGSYADALKVLVHLPDIQTCCRGIVKGLKEVVIEKEKEMKDYLKDINNINNELTIRKEIIRNSYK